MNKVVLIGRLTKDPEIASTQSGHLNARFNLAVNRKFAKEGCQDTDFIPISVWGKTAEFVSMYFKKGMRIAVAGRLEVNTFTDKDGKNRTFTQVVGEEVDFADGKRNEEETSEIEKKENTLTSNAFNIDGDEILFADLGANNVL